MKKHTPSPWHVEAAGSIWSELRGNKNSRIAVVCSDQQGLDDVDLEAEANAAHIVRCVNAHEELLEAIKRVREMMDAPCHCHDDPITPGKCDFCVARRIMDKAIAKAESRP